MTLPARVDFSKMPTLQRLTEKQARFVLAKGVAGLSNRRAAEFAGYDATLPDRLRNIGGQVANHPDVKAALAELAAIHGNPQKGDDHGAD